MNTVKSNLCFVLMPFTIGFTNQWELAIKVAIENIGMKPWRGDEKSLGSNIIIQDVTKCIYKADIIVADVTGLNPNVMYELGLAHAAKKPVVIITQNESEIPFDVSHIRYLTYDINNLKKLQNDLGERLRYTLEIPEEQKADLFPELKFMDESLIKELEYLRRRTFNLEIRVNPSTADIFFNDNYIGNSPQNIRVNSESQRNTISIAASSYVEYHKELSLNDINKGLLEISLESRSKIDINKRVPRWLKDRRKDPNNPVLMRAIAQYLFSIGEVEEALHETEELIKIAPTWYLSHNQAGFILSMTGKYTLSLKHYCNVISLKPENYIGYYNLACVFSKMERYEDCLKHIDTILKKTIIIFSYDQGLNKFDTDNAFNNIKNNSLFGLKFNNLIYELDDKIKQLKSND